MIKTDILVIGAGIVGLSTALRLLNLGREVLLVAPEAGRGTAAGSAGTIADYSVLPVGSPDILKNLPALLFNQNSPFALRRTAIFSLAPWLARFLYESTPARTAKNAQAIANLAADARRRWLNLAKQINGESLLQKNGCLYVYETPEEFQKGSQDIARRKAFGVAAEMLTPHELAKLEPNLADIKGGAAFFYDAVFMDAPDKMLELLHNAVIAAGGLLQKTRAVKIERNGGGVLAHLENAAAVRANHIVIAAGAHSKLLAKQAGDRIPLETERGYHVEYDMKKPPLGRPVCLPGRGFYLCPMRGRLRAAGTVELGGLNPAVSARRIEYLKRAAAGVFPHLPEPNRHWLGFRPSIPDSRPVISASSRGGDIIYAFGHGHIGITLAPITAEIVASIIMKTPPPISIGDYSANRF